MTQQQKTKIEEVQEAIKNARNDLDSLMYYSEPLPDEDFEKVRGCYELLCQASDKLC